MLVGVKPNRSGLVVALDGPGSSGKSSVGAAAALELGYRFNPTVWGGVYQYSATADWKSPHFEKLISYQADQGAISISAISSSGISERSLSVAHTLA